MHKGNRLPATQAVEKILELLELLATGGEHLRIGELAGRLGVSRKEVLILLVTLESRALLRWDEQARIYRPGCKTGEGVRNYLAQTGMQAVEVVPRTIKAPRTVGSRRGRADLRRVAAGT